MTISKKTWRDDALLATRGSQFGAILSCALGRTIPAPYFVGKASITSDGYIVCDFVGRDGDYHMGAFVGSFDDLTKNFSGLSEHLNLTDRQRVAFMNVLTSWIGTDHRS